MLGGASTISADLDAITEVTAIIEQRTIRTVFQPIVRLDTRETVAYEALSRGPSGSRWGSPTALYCAAAAIGRTAELDWVCRASAYRAALQAGLSPAVPLFVGSDPAAAQVPCPADLRPVVDRAHSRLRVVIELTERGVWREPAALLVGAQAARMSGCGVAVGDVGVDPAALALLPLIRPDVIKLDGYLLQRPAHVETARAVTAVAAYADRVGAVVLAEGLATADQITTARTMGATLGQGCLLGRPASLPGYEAIPTALSERDAISAASSGVQAAAPAILDRPPAGSLWSDRPVCRPVPRSDAELSPVTGEHTEQPPAGCDPNGPLEPLRLLDEPEPGVARQQGTTLDCGRGETPYDIVALARQVTLADQATLLSISRYLETMAYEALAEPPALLTCIQDAQHFTGAAKRRYAALAERAALVAVFGAGVAEDPAGGVTGVPLEPGELLCDEWHVIVVGPHFAAALVARDLGDRGEPSERRFVHAVTYDRDLVLAAARPLLRRLASSRLASSEETSSSLASSRPAS